ncbi:MAG: hypothetical protein Faunusvirus43_4 [Faunusvirus sp.]|jgi:hypothetical protein|uniref:Uncharacterized protein n=1 Tax=Faunusvirus sp. TaxID=2487766 RepID=A0A3G4ZXT6_9VIRU|nr:MAG: hypothetical protein Faunusvirus43_4 [Faunusvirus sp.]
MPDYSKGKIYRLSSPSTTDVYIGSTCRTLTHRLNGHRDRYNRWKEGKRDYTTACDIMQYNDVEITLLVEVNCANKTELHAHERYYIETTNCINKIIPGQTIREWREKNKDAVAIKQREYNLKHKDILAAKKREYILKKREDKKKNEVIVVKIDDGMSKHKRYYEKNKAEIAARNKITYFCECGAKVVTEKKTRHLFSRKHLDAVTSKS